MGGYRLTRLCLEGVPGCVEAGGLQERFRGQAALGSNPASPVHEFYCGRHTALAMKVGVRAPASWHHWAEQS